MGNIFAECRRCSLEQCELCTDVNGQRGGLGQQGAPALGANQIRPAANAGAAGAAGVPQPRGAAGNAGPQVRDGGANARPGSPYVLANMTEAEMMRRAMEESRFTEQQRQQRDGGGPRLAAGHEDGPGPAGAPLGEDQDLMAAIVAGAGHTNGRAAPTEEELALQAARRAKEAEEARERQRLIEEQHAEYQESLLIDRQREEERRRKQTEDEELQRKEEEEAAQAEEAEKQRQASIKARIDEARERLQPEPDAAEAGRVLVQLVVPDGRRLRRGFRPADQVSQLYDFADADGGEDVASHDYRLVSRMPRQVFEDREATLEASQLKGQCALLVEVLDD